MYFFIVGSIRFFRSPSSMALLYSCN